MRNPHDYELLHLPQDGIQSIHQPQDHHHIHDRTLSPPNKEPVQSWANGLRGATSLLVMFHHLIVAFDAHATLNTSDASGIVHLWQWPILRTATSPKFMVTIFFILSGYVLSYRPLHRLEQRPSAAVSVRNSLASACLRRSFRLIPPPTVSVVISHIILLCGGFELARSGKIGDWWVAEYSPRWVTTSWPAQTMEGLKSLALIWYRNNTPTSYNVVLWTMPEELRGSLNVYLFLLATSTLQRRFRTMLAILLALVQLLVKETSTLQFIVGLLIAEVQVSRSEPSNCRNPQTYGYLRLLVFWTTLLIALMCGSVPYFDMQSASWSRRMYLLAKIHSSNEEEVKSLYLLIGGGLLVLTISQWQAARRIFSFQVLQYLGKISFSLYVIHVPLLMSLGVLLVNSFRQLGMSDRSSVLCMTPFWFVSVIVSSSLMTRFVDEKAIEISHKLETMWGVHH